MFKLTNWCHSQFELDSEIHMKVGIRTFWQKTVILLPFTHKIQDMKTWREESINLRIQYKCINISFSSRAFGIPWWNIVSINNITVFSRRWVVYQFRSRGDLGCLSRVMKCCHREPCSIRISDCPMLTAPVLSIGYNLVPKEFSVSWKLPKQKSLVELNLTFI